MSESLTVFSTCQVALQRDKLGSALQRHAVIDMVVIHVAVDAVSRPANTAGDGSGIKTDRVGQRLQGSVNFLAGVQPNKDIVAALRPLQGKRDLSVAQEAAV